MNLGLIGTDVPMFMLLRGGATRAPVRNNKLGNFGRTKLNKESLLSPGTSRVQVVPPVTLWPIDRESCNICHGQTRQLRRKMISVLVNSLKTRMDLFKIKLLLLLEKKSFVFPNCNLIVHSGGGGLLIT